MVARKKQNGSNNQTKSDTKMSKPTK